jgi:hypothetical protein
MPHDGHDHQHPKHHPGRGHNNPGRVAVQWQRPEGEPVPIPGEGEPDLDLVENAFCEAALAASDPTSLLRLARIPFIAELADGTRIRLLSYSIEHEAEIGSVAPGFTAAEPVYHPIPASRVATHRRLRFRYHTAAGLRDFTLAELRGLAELTPPR